MEFAGWDFLLVAINALVIQPWVALPQLIVVLWMFSPAVIVSVNTICEQNVCLVVAISRIVKNKDKKGGSNEILLLLLLQVTIVFTVIAFCFVPYKFMCTFLHSYSI